MGELRKWCLLLATLATLLTARASEPSAYEKDMTFALETLGRE